MVAGELHSESTRYGSYSRYEIFFYFATSYAQEYHDVAKLDWAPLRQSFALLFIKIIGAAFILVGLYV